MFYLILFMHYIMLCIYITVAEHVPVLKAYILQCLFFLIKLWVEQGNKHWFHSSNELPINLLQASHRDTLLMF